MPLRANLLDLESAILASRPRLEVSYREHPGAPRGKPKATVRVDLIPGLAVFFSGNRKRWRATSIIFDPETSVNIWTKVVVQKIKPDGLVLLLVSVTLANLCNTRASNGPSVADEMRAIVEKLDQDGPWGSSLAVETD